MRGKARQVWATAKLLGVWTALGPPAALVGIPYTLAVGDISRLFRVAMWIVRAGVRAAGITVRVSGRENVPVGRACIFISNHVSNLDPPVLMPEIPGRFAILLKKELMNIPLLGTAMRMAKFVPVERGAEREAAQRTVAAAAAALKEGLHIIVYPEGTRSVDGRLSGFKKGPFFLAVGTGAPIVPVAIWGTREMMKKGDAWVTPGEARIVLLPAIEPGECGSREELMVAVRAAIAGALPEGMRPQS